MPKTEYAEGVWCTECEYFEEPDISMDRCLACGCPASKHREAVVVD